MKTYTIYRKKAKRLLELHGITSTDCAEYVYGDKGKKSKLSQKKTGKTTIMFEEASKIIEYYAKIAQKIDDIISK